jgi:hypothetical protein
MKESLSDGCSVPIGGFVLLLFFWVLTKIVDVFNPQFLANSRFCCLGASLLMVFMFMFDQDALKEADANLRYVFILLLIAVGVWILAAPAKTLLAHIQTWLVAHPNVGLTLLGIACLGPVVLPLLLIFFIGPPAGRASQSRYHASDSYDN